MRQFTELPIRKSLLVPQGCYLLSAGGTQIYRVLSAPCCQIYWQHWNDKDCSQSLKDRLVWTKIDSTDTDNDRVTATPWKTESGWIEVDGQWKKPKGAFPSYQVALMIDRQECAPSYLTLRWQPQYFESLAEAEKAAEQHRTHLCGVIVRPVPLDRTQTTINLALEKMKCNRE